MLVKSINVNHYRRVLIGVMACEYDQIILSRISLRTILQDTVYQIRLIVSTISPSMIGALGYGTEGIWYMLRNYRSKL